MIFGYARVSTQEQNLNLQIDSLNKYGCDQIFQEKATGANTERPELNELLKRLRQGDKVVIYKLDRISRSTKHLIELSEMLNDKGVDLVSLQDSIDTSTSMGRFFFRTMASIAELERDIISERTRSGLESARARGRLGGRPPKNQKKIELAIKMYESKQHTLKEITEATGISKGTLYNYIKKEKEKGKNEHK